MLWGKKELRVVTLKRVVALQEREVPANASIRAVVVSKGGGKNDEKRSTEADVGGSLKGEAMNS